MDATELSLRGEQSDRVDWPIQNHEINASNQRSSQGQHALPPADQGHQAWLCLTGCFVANVLVWGFAFSFGVLQEYYTTHEPFAAHPTGIPAVGTTATGLGYLTMPIYFLTFQKFPRWRRWSCFVSLPLIAVALVGASFANTVPQLLFCQGILYALAGNALITPTITYLDEWFVRRKGLAIGIMWAGDGTGGVIMPLLMQAMLARIGFRWVGGSMNWYNAASADYTCRLFVQLLQSSSY
nr:putative transporter mch4 [Quercus suber]